MTKTFKLPKLKCLRCGHVWIPRKPQEPKKCARCASPYWNKVKWKGILQSNPSVQVPALTDSQRFRQYLKLLTDELVWATCHFKVWEQLWPSTEQIAHVENLYLDFFQLTRQAHNDQFLLRLSKILDRHSDSISLFKLICQIELHPNVLSYRQLDLSEVKARLGEKEALFGRLKTLRDKKLAHIDRQFHLSSSLRQSLHIYVGESRAILHDLDETMTEISVCYDGTVPVFETPGIGNVGQLLDDLISLQEKNE